MFTSSKITFIANFLFQNELKKKATVKEIDETKEGKDKDEEKEKEEPKDDKTAGEKGTQYCII